MSQKPGVERIRREIIQCCHAGFDSRTLRMDIVRRLRKVVPLDASFFTTVDPATLLFTGAVVDEILASVTPQFLQNEFLQDDVNKFIHLAKSARPVESLTQATQNQLYLSPRYREILAPLGLGDELRAAFVTGNTCWGFLCLHRDRSGPGFTTAETAFLNQLIPHIAEGLRKSLLYNVAVDPKGSDEPGLLLLTDDLTVVAVTPAAERWLAEIAGGKGLRKQALPDAVSAVVARLQALEQGVDTQPELIPKVRLQTPSGQWLVLHASRLAGSSHPGQVAVIFEVAHPVEIASLLVQVYRLSKREGDIVQSVVQGLSTAEIARIYHISENTVQDHLKSIFEKVGVRSRRELTAQLFTEQFQPQIAAGHDLDESGWFRIPREQ